MKIIVQNIKIENNQKQKDASLGDCGEPFWLGPCGVEFWCSPTYCDGLICSPRIDPY